MTATLQAEAAQMGPLPVRMEMATPMMDAVHPDMNTLLQMG
jgi:hypothetical protein